MMNDKLVLGWSQAFADRVLNDSGLDEKQRIDRAYRIAFSRIPKPEERAQVAEFLKTQSAMAGEKQAFADFCHVLLSSNEFLYIN
jgi:hypothetical protein